MKHIAVLVAIFWIFTGCSTKFKNSQEPKPYVQVQTKQIKLTKPVKPFVPQKRKTKKLTPSQIAYNKRVSYVRQKAKPHWGEKALVANRYQYVRYDNNFKARTVIDFEKATVHVETTTTHNTLQTLQAVIASALLSPQNPETIDLFSSRHTTHVGEPFLYERVVDHDGKPIRWKWRANRYAKYLIDTALKKKTVQTSEGTKTSYYVTFDMKKQTYSTTSNRNYASIVKEQSRRFGLNEALIFALIETESHFNPYATSAIPAYGLMQVVPRSAGRDAWQLLYKKKGKPTRKYLFNARNNIQMGTAYMHILQTRYLVKVHDTKKRELCAIAAYNTGSGNVLRSFHRNKNIAFKKINTLSYSALYAHLRKRLPYVETRNYIKKVTAAKKRYQ